MKADLGVWMYVLAGLFVSAVVLLKASSLLAAFPSKGNPWPLYHFLKVHCGENASAQVMLEGPFEVEVVNGSFCYEGECLPTGCGYNFTFGVGRGSYVYEVVIKGEEVELWPVSQT